MQVEVIDSHIRQQFKTSLQYNHRQDQQKLMVTFTGGFPPLLVTLSLLLLAFFFFLSLPSPPPAFAPLHTLQHTLPSCPGGCRQEVSPAHLLQEICYHRVAPPTLPASWKMHVPCILPPFIFILSLLPLLTHPSCHSTLSSGISFHAQLPQDHLLARIFFLKRHYPKPCNPQATWCMRSEQNSTSEGHFCFHFACKEPQQKKLKVLKEKK